MSVWAGRCGGHQPHQLGQPFSMDVPSLLE
jgi:hypothetical protein